MKKRVAALLCAAAVWLCSVSAHAINAGDVYFTSVNDQLLPLTMDTMPTWVNGRLYVPASVFDNTASGVDLGLHFRQNNNTVTLYSLRQMLVFDLNRGIAYDQHTGKSLPERAVNRNGRIYLPVETVCDFFALEDSYNYTQYGYLLRIKSDAAWLNDADFIDAAGTPMSNALQEILRGQQESSRPDTPPAPPVVVEPPDQPDAPVTPERPNEQVRAQTQVYLAVRCGREGQTERILDLLDELDCPAMFFFEPEQLAARDDLVRRVVGSGHGIGLLVTADTAEESRSLLLRGNELLARIVRTGATAVMAPTEQRAALEEDGWVCWRDTTNAQPRGNERAAAYAQRIVTALGDRRTARLTVDDNAYTARSLSALLGQLNSGDYRVMLPLETRL